MRQHILRGITFLLAVGLILFFLRLEYEEEESSPLSVYVGAQVVQAWEDGGVYTLFLPAFGASSKVSLTPFSAGFTVKGTELAFRQGDSLKSLPLDEALPCVWEDGGEFVLRLMQSESLSAVFIETASGSLERIWADKEYRGTGAVCMVDGTGTMLLQAALEEFGGRGNTSYYNYDKKPFSLRLAEEASFPGLPAGEGYALLSNASDPLLFRNDLGRRMEEALGVDYAQPGQFVDVYINEAYQGNYYLCADVEIGRERINITDTEGMMDLLYQKSDYERMALVETAVSKARELPVIPEDITGGYLLEREFESRYLTEYETMGSGFITDKGEHFLLKSPRYLSVEQMEYIRGLMNEIEEAIYAPDGINAKTGKSYGDYLDTDSFAKRYLTEEVSKNYDGGVSSVYFYKDSDSVDGRLYYGPGWDYDMSWGNGVEWMEEFSANPWGISELNIHENCSLWYTYLCDKEDFSSLVRQFYRKQARPFLLEMAESGLEGYEALLAASWEMNRVRWSKELTAVFGELAWEKELGELKEFIVLRTAYLDGEWLQ